MRRYLNLRSGNRNLSRICSKKVEARMSGFGFVIFAMLVFAGLAVCRGGKMKILIAITAMLLFATFAQAQYTPDSGSPERKAIMDGLRTRVRSVLKKPVMFRVGSLRVKDGWAVVSAELLKPDGTAFDWSGTRYERAWRRGDDFEGGVQALLRKRGNTWQVLDYGLDATDYAMGEACRKRGCPAALR